MRVTCRAGYVNGSMTASTAEHVVALLLLRRFNDSANKIKLK